jgi:F0F1-type ATP synthase membrane subunit b/b'
MARRQFLKWITEQAKQLSEAALDRLMADLMHSYTERSQNGAPGKVLADRLDERAIM